MAGDKLLVIEQLESYRHDLQAIIDLMEGRGTSAADKSSAHLKFVALRARLKRDLKRLAGMKRRGELSDVKSAVLVPALREAGRLIYSHANLRSERTWHHQLYWAKIDIAHHLKELRCTD